ncbi:Abi-alpha family protein [Agrobacterium tumefaciens]|uniref:Abi-alpha family protein n=1 Tax=Agrobacterium tumefaciens TaxID=358 RepID=UPI00287D8FE6|nr:Abi-alpha family protein [Agrobacterium tumefaciens]MDS7596404.1 DUF4393 domain-containing protein [Agrobacterium tumefaciens]
MAESTDLATAIATEVAKQIPVKEIYEDAGQPGAKQIGSVIEDLTKTLHLVLAPFQLTAALQDRLRRYIDNSLRRVPKEQRIAPPPQILGPIFEGVRYEPEGTPIDEMFSRLLSSSMNSERVQNAHPAFPLLIKQISSDEALLLCAMWNRLKTGRSFRQQFTHDYDAYKKIFTGQHIEIDEIPREDLSFPENIGFYGQHLYALGLTAFYDSANQEPLFKNGTNNPQTGVRVFKELRLTDFGIKFMSAVTD